MVKRKNSEFLQTDLLLQQTMAEFEVKKMKQGMSYSCKEKTIILNVFKYFRCQYPDKCVTDIVRRTAKATGCSEKSVFQFRKEESSVEGFKQPSKTKVRKNININSRDIKYDNTVRTQIRNIIYDLRYKNIVPSLNTILKQIKATEQMPKFSIMTLRRLMFDMGFSYQKNGNKCILIEKPDSRFQPNANNEMINQNIPQKLIQQQQQPTAPPPISDHSSMNSLAKPQPISDPRLSVPLMQKPMHMPQISTAPPPSSHNPNLMPMQSEMDHIYPAHHNMHNKPMPMMNIRRDIMSIPGPPPIPVLLTTSLDLKREPMQPWMHGMIKQGQ